MSYYVTTSSGTVYGTVPTSFVIAYNCFIIAFCVFIVFASWKLFVKAGKPGWAAIIPIYSQYTMFEIVYGEGNGWKFLLMLIPFYNIYRMIRLYIDMAHAYNQSTGFGVGMIFFSFIFFPILGFGKAQYIGPQKF